MPDTSLVRRARKIDRVLARDLPRRPLRARLRQPLRAARRHRAVSAQTTDKRVNAVRPTLFAAYPDAHGDGRRPTATKLEQIIRPTGFFRAKTESLLKLCAGAGRAVTTARCPPRLDDLVTLPGVGRKTANVVLGNAFGIPGITVDTHFGRLARRFGWTERDRPGQGRARGRRAVPQARLDDAQPPPDLARPPGLPRPEPRLRRLPGRALVPVVRRGADRPGAGGEAGEDRGPGMRRLVLALLVAVAAGRLRAVARRLVRRRRRLATARRRRRRSVDVDTPALRALKKQTRASRTARARRPARSTAACPT